MKWINQMEKMVYLIKLEIVLIIKEFKIQKLIILDQFKINSCLNYLKHLKKDQNRRLNLGKKITCTFLTWQNLIQSKLNAYKYNWNFLEMMSLNPQCKKSRVKVQKPKASEMPTSKWQEQKLWRKIVYIMRLALSNQSNRGSPIS